MLIFDLVGRGVVGGWVVGERGGGGWCEGLLGILRKGRERIWHVCHIGEIITDEEISSLGTFRASIYSHLSTRFSRRLSGPGPGTTESSGGVEGGGGGRRRSASGYGGTFEAYEKWNSFRFLGHSIKLGTTFRRSASGFDWIRLIISRGLFVIKFPCC